MTSDKGDSMIPNQRLFDLVRHQRGELHTASLITDDEYAELAKDNFAVGRMLDYDKKFQDMKLRIMGAFRAVYQAAKCKCSPDCKNISPTFSLDDIEKLTPQDAHDEVINLFRDLYDSETAIRKSAFQQCAILLSSHHRDLVKMQCVCGGAKADGVTPHEIIWANHMRELAGLPPLGPNA